MAPGESGWAQVKLEAPLAPVKGDHFIIRSPNETLGGGRIVAIQPLRHRRFHQPTLQGLELAERGTPQDLLLRALDEKSPCAASVAARSAGLPWQDAKSLLQVMVSQGQAETLGTGAIDGESYVISPSGWARLRAQADALLRDYHRRLPLRPGMPREELKSRLGLPPKPLGEALRRLDQDGAIVEGRGWVRHAEHVVLLDPAQEARVQSFLGSLRANPYSPPSDQMLEPELLNLLIDEGRVIKVGDDVVFEAGAYRQMVEKIIEHIQSRGQITVAEARDLFNSSRKYALALLEHLDQEKVTQRIGDQRVLRS
jgi:selenocysteine-specific elongation factor